MSTLRSDHTVACRRSPRWTVIGRFPRRTSEIPALAIVLLLSTGMGTAQGAPIRPAEPPSLAHHLSTTVTLGTARPLAGGAVVFGSLRGWFTTTAPGPQLSGVGITAVVTPCKGFDNCSSMATTVTGHGGAWNLALPSGTYSIYSNASLGFGGAEAQVTVAGSSVGPVNLSVYPLVGYQNTTFLLPNWNNLSRYAENCNLALPCVNGVPSPPYGSQVPITSWTQDGVFYVNSSDDLVFYSFANGTVRNISAWLPLYDNLMDYDGIENTEWITADGSVVYEFGCLALCATNSSVRLYAVNVTTGRSFQWTVTGLTDANFENNAQIDMLGESGNMSIASVIDAAGLDVGYNLWNGTQWNLTKLPFFEANNNYWVPQLESYFDVQAGGSIADHVDQFRLEGTTPGTKLVQVATTTFATMYRCNGVNGLVFNATNRTLAFTAQNASGSAITLLYEVEANGTIGPLLRSWGNTTSHFGSGPNTSAYPNVESSEHRPTYVSNGPAYAGFWNGWFQNRSWLVDIGTGNWYDTNQTFNHPDPFSYTYKENHLNPSALEGLFLNSTYALIPWSYDCRTVKSTCPILGTASTPSSPGTVWWTWRTGAPEFPYDPATSIAQTAPPGDPTALNLTTFGRSIGVRWDPPTTGSDPLINYTVYFGTNASDLNHSLSVAPQATSTSFTASSPGTEYFVEVQAWNLHWHSAGIVGNITSGLLFGTLNLTVLPVNATVLVDGRATTTTGGVASLVLEQGTHRVDVTFPGYYPNSSFVGVTWDNTSILIVTLIGIPPVLQGTIFPTWASLELGGAPVPVSGNGSFHLVLSPGTFIVDATALGYVPFGPANLSFAYGDVQNLSIVLGRTMGWIDGLVSPASAAVTLNGEPIPTPNGTFDLELATGLYWLDVFAPGYHPQTVGPIDVTYGAIAPEVVHLEPYNGTWNFDVMPSDSTLTVDNQSVPLVDGQAVEILPPGTHSFLATGTGYDPFGYTGDVGPNSTTMFVVVLNESVGWITGTVSPNTAAVSVDGLPIVLGPGGTFNRTLLPGRHVLVATAPGFEEQVTPVNVTPARTSFVDLRLTPSPGTTASPSLTTADGWGILGLAVLVGLVVVIWIGTRRGRRSR